MNAPTDTTTATTRRGHFGSRFRPHKSRSVQVFVKHGFGRVRRASTTSVCCTSARGRIHRANTSSVWSSARGGTTSRLLQQCHLLHQRLSWSPSRHQQTSPHLLLLCTTPRQLQQCTWPCSWGFCWPAHAVPRVAEHLSLSPDTCDVETKSRKGIETPTSPLSRRSPVDEAGHVLDAQVEGSCVLLWRSWGTSGRAREGERNSWRRLWCISVVSCMRAHVMGVRLLTTAFFSLFSLFHFFSLFSLFSLFLTFFSLFYLF